MRVTESWSVLRAPAPMSDVVVRLRNVHRRFPGCHAVRGVDLDLHRGEFAALVGRSGSGKSTVLNIVGLLDRPTSGEYELLGEPTARMSGHRCSRLRAQRLGYVFQAFHLLDTRTVVENVELGALYLGLPYRERRGGARKLLAQFGLANKATARPRTLSGGERQRVAIARALMGRPDVVLCDEPTGNLDSQNAAVIMAALRQLTDSGSTVLLVTHDAAAAAEADRVFRIGDGRLE
jgi:putative ABC transport system ATP-binding protein